MHLPPAAEPPQLSWRDVVLAVAILGVALVVFLRSPVSNLGDSKYTLLLTQSLLSRGSFTLDPYGIPHEPTAHYGDADLLASDYRIEVAGGHSYYYFPPGSSVLSAPFVVGQDLLGKGVLRPDGSYSLRNEDLNGRFIAAVLMAGLGVVFYFTARLLLPPGWSALIALGGVLGTQIWSTASRAMWTHTWGVALVGVAVYLLFAHETGRRRLSPVLLATVLSWAYFVRPTHSVLIVGVTIYLLLCHRAAFWAYAWTGAAWFAAFAAYSWEHFGRLLPSYYSAARLETTTLREALAGNLVSPSRGLLVFVPVAGFVVYLVLRYWRYRLHPRLLWLGVAVCACQYAAVSAFVPWNGGGCYGPRYTTELVPWLVAAAILGVAAARRRHEDYGRPFNRAAWRATLAAGGALLLVSIAIQARGATSTAAMWWNTHPDSVDDHPWRVWDWRYPQFLAGIIQPPLPDAFPAAAPGRRVVFGRDDVWPYEYDNWSNDGDFSWSVYRHATLLLAGDGPAPARLRLDFGPYVHPPRLPRQRVKIFLNDRPLASLTIDDPNPHEYTLTVPTDAWHGRNFLRFDLPDAVSPESIGDGHDPRELGVALRWLELDDAEAPAPSPP